jgi:hypothetical protein
MAIEMSNLLGLFGLCFKLSKEFTLNLVSFFKPADLTCAEKPVSRTDIP